MEGVLEVKERNLLKWRKWSSILSAAENLNMMEFNNLPLALAVWRSSETLKMLCPWSGQENTVDVVSREIGRRIEDMKFRYF